MKQVGKLLLDILTRCVLFLVAFYNDLIQGLHYKVEGSDTVSGKNTVL